jgi:YegS/Rv2252/BmrU family lipid kinase
MRVLLIGNPAAGGGRGASRLRAVEALLARSGARVDAVLTDSVGHAARLLRSPPQDVDRVIACGGDGLVQEVADALAGSGSGLALAIVPAGRGNDMARALAVPLNLAEAAHLATTGTVRRVDLGLANGRHFCTVAAAGIDAEVSRRARVSSLPLPGPTAYVVHVLRALPSCATGFDARLMIDGRRLDERLLLAACANSRSYGGGFRIAPGARIDDGRLELCLIRSTSLLRAALLAPRVFAGTHRGLREVSLVACEEFRLETAPPLRIEADGEPIAASPCVYRVARGALCAIVGDARIGRAA